MKTDARVRYTRKVIQEAFLEILKEKPVAKVTVKEICDRAEINRGTFYKHYQDCYDLMDKMEEETLLQFEEMLSSIQTTGIYAVLLTILKNLRDNTQLIPLLFCGMAETMGSRNFVHKLMECYFRHMNKWPGSSLGSDLSEERRTAGFAFLAGGCGGVIEYWLHSGMKEPPEEIANLIVTLSKNVVDGRTE